MILCIGHASYDITIPMDEYPIENKKYRINGKLECGGGPASNAAYLIAKWGIPCYFMGTVGNDLYGQRIMEEFKKVGVNISYMELDDNYPTTVSYILVNNSLGTRTIFACRDERMQLKNAIFNEIPDIILIDGHEYATSKAILDDYPKAVSIIDAGRCTDEVIELSKKVNYLICSKEFAETYAGEKIDLDNPQTLLRVYMKLYNDFKNTVVITLEARGCAYKLDNVIKVMPSYKMVVRDTTGAGDIFHGAFAYAIHNKYDLEASLRIATIASALSIEHVGGRNSIRSLEEVMRFYEKVK